MRSIGGALAAVMLAGCTVMQDAPRRLGSCGIALAVFVAHPRDARYEYFRIDDGVLHYGGGSDALLMKTSWSAPMTREQCDRVLELSRAAGWCDLEAKSRDGESDAAMASVAVAWEGGRVQFRRPASEATAAAVIAYLDRLARARLEKYLDRLPEAGLQR